MLLRAALVVTIFLIFIRNQTVSFKTQPELKKQYKEFENKELSSSDHLVGRALDFIYSNKTFMNLIARELWNVGSRAIDTIVKVKGNMPAN